MDYAHSPFALPLNRAQRAAGIGALRKSLSLGVGRFGGFALHAALLVFALSGSRIAAFAAPCSKRFSLPLGFQWLVDKFRLTGKSSRKGLKT